MHELHLIRAVVRLVEEAVRDSGAARADLVRLAVRPGRHSWDEAAIRTAFAAISLGTVAEGAGLEIHQASDACTWCGAARESEKRNGLCQACGGIDLSTLGEPEIRLQDVVVRL